MSSTHLEKTRKWRVGRIKDPFLDAVVNTSGDEKVLAGHELCFCDGAKVSIAKHTNHSSNFEIPDSDISGTVRRNKDSASTVGDIFGSSSFTSTNSWVETER